MSSSSSDRPADRPEFRSTLRPGPLPLYQVILHRPDHPDPIRTLRTIMELMRFPLQEATQKMREARDGGSCRLLVTHRERAELVAERFMQRKLQVSIEPV